MKKYFSRSIIAFLLALTFVFLSSCTNTEDISNNSETTAATTIATIAAPDTPPLEVPFKISSVTRQDNTRSVIMWNFEEGYTYNVYRSTNPRGTFSMIGTSDVGSFMDDRTDTTTNYYYKVEKVKIGEVQGEFSAPVKIGYKAQNVTRVHTIMYHNVISDADIEAGEPFDGYYTIKVEEFEEDLIWLRDNGYNTITSEDLWMYMNGELTLPEKPVIISIDDGDHGIYRNVYPLLREYGMKADFNVVCEWIDESTKLVEDGDTTIVRFCTWDELKEMDESGIINVCSHTYGLHKNPEDGRLGVMINDGESESDYAAAMAGDYGKVLETLGKIKADPLYTMAYPGSVRNILTDRIILGSTNYQILMAGPKARGTNANYFVDGCDFETQYVVMSRPCRYHRKSISYYIQSNEKIDGNLGIDID